MKKYKSQIQEYFKNVLSYKNHNIYDVEHSIIRFKERVSSLDILIYFNLLKKGIDWIIKSNKEKIEDRYIFISKKYGFGIQVEWRKDRYKNVFNGYSATTFSNNEMNFFTKADKEVFLENITKQHAPKNALFIIDSLSSLIEKKCKDQINSKYYSYKFENELKEETDLINMNMFIEQGIVYYTYIFIKL